MSCSSTLPGALLVNLFLAWLCSRRPVMLRKFVRLNKNNDLVEVQLLDANPSYANIRYSDGREGNVSVSDLSPCPRKPIGSEVDSQNLSVADEELTMRRSPDDICDEQSFLSIPETTTPKTQTRCNKKPLLLMTSGSLLRPCGGSDLFIPELI